MSIGYGDGLNIYNYVHGDPINGIDPSGLQEDAPTEVTVYVHATGYDPHLDGKLSPVDDSFDDLRRPKLFVSAGNLPVTVVVVGKRRKKVAAAGGGAPPSQPTCVIPGPQFQCNAQGKLEETPAYAKKACDNYNALMKSTRQVGRFTGSAGLANGSRGLIQKGFGIKFLTTPMIFDVFMFAASGTTFLTGLAPPPEGCKVQ